MNEQSISTSHRIDALLRQNSINRTELADELGLSRSVVSQKMTGKTRWTLRDLGRIADTFDVSLDYLTGRADK